MPKQSATLAQRRIQLDMPERSLTRLQDLKDRTEATSYAEVLRNALRLYEFFVNETQSGRKLVVRDESGLEREILGPVLP